jgi:hypothetical protein
VTRVPSALVAAVTLLVGYAVAAGTGLRALGGVVLLAGLAWCAVVWRRSRSTTVAAGLSVAFLALFVLSHLLARAIGAWPSVVVVSLTMAALTWPVADAPARRHRLPA